VNFKENQEKENREEEIFFAGGCLWGVQEFIRHLPGVICTEAGRANGSTNTTNSAYDGYAECVRTIFNPTQVKYRTGVYSREQAHLLAAKQFIEARDDASKVMIEVMPLSNFVRSDEEHQDRLQKNPKEECHIPKNLLYKYRIRDF